MPNLQSSFTGRHVCVTGAAQGIGFAIARAFSLSGASVILADLHAPEKLNELKNARYLKLDVSDRKSCAEFAAQIDKLDILVNNAGITRDKTLSKLSDEEFDQVVNVNLTGVFNMTKALLNKFSGSQNRIVNMSSVVGIYGNFGQTNYAAAKAGVIAMTKTWARELGRKGFTVNAIAPGFIETPMTAAMPKEALTAMAAKVPAARLGQPEDIANACLFLASEEASYINGAVLTVDGGLVV